MQLCCTRHLYARPATCCHSAALPGTQKTDCSCVACHCGFLAGTGHRCNSILTIADTSLLVAGMESGCWPTCCLFPVTSLRLHQAAGQTYEDALTCRHALQGLLHSPLDVSARCWPVSCLCDSQGAPQYPCRCCCVPLLQAKEHGSIPTDVLVCALGLVAAAFLPPTLRVLGFTTGIAAITFLHFQRIVDYNIGAQLVLYASGGISFLRLHLGSDPWAHFWPHQACSKADEAVVTWLVPDPAGMAATRG